MEVPKGPRQIDPRDLGVQVLVHGESPLIDIVAVHGLGATPSTTWSKALKLQESSDAALNITSQTDESRDRVNWLSSPKMLPANVTNARIMTFNYDSNWYGDDAVKVRLDHVANKLRRQVERERRDCHSRPLIFIGHCFGGLVIEKALVKPEATKLLNATTGVVLLGTPHRGTDNVTASELLQRIIRAGVRGEGASLTALQADNEMVLDAVQGFATTAREKNISVHCFFEQRSSKVSKMFGDDYKDFIVDEASAILSGCETYGLPLDHYQLNKFSDPEDGNWRELSGVIVDLCEDALAKNQPDAAKEEGRSGQVNNFSGTFSTGGGKAFYGSNFNSGGGSMNF